MPAGSEEAVAAAPAPATSPGSGDLRALGYQGAADRSAPKPVQARKLIRTMELDLAVRDTEGVAQQVQDLAGRLGGYVSAVSAQRRDEVLYYSITLRIPAERFAEAVGALKALAGRVDRESQQVEDVTDQYVDLDARKRTLAATEAELLALLAESRQKARKVEEIMAVYRELTEVRGQIEQIQGQLNSLDKRAALSTINLSLRPVEAARPVTAPGWAPGDTARGSIRTLLAVLRGLVDFLIFAAIVLLPLGLLLAVLFIVLRRLWRRLARSRRGGPPAAPPPVRSAGGN